MRGAGDILNTLKCTYDGRSKFPKALREEFLGKQIRQSLKVGGQRSRDREEKGSVRKKKKLLKIVINTTEIEPEWREHWGAYPFEPWPLVKPRVIR